MPFPPSGNFGVLGTSDTGVGGYFKSESNAPLVAFGGTNIAFYARTNGGDCFIDYNANLNCTGSKNAVVPVDGGSRIVALSAIESPKNWFEDFGSEHLSNGVATITLEPEFAQTVNTEQNYHVYLTPNGDCKGLYVSQKTSTSFEVRELGGGTSNVTFDYRIVALRKNFEDIRLADHTHDLDAVKQMESRMGGAPHVPFDANKLLEKRPLPTRRAVSQVTNK